MNKYVYLKDLPRMGGISRYDKVVMTTFLTTMLAIDNLTNKQVPSDLTADNSTYNTLISEVLGKYYEKPVGVIRCNAPWAFEHLPTDGDKETISERFAYSILLVLNRTHERYVTLLTSYANAKANLMADVKSTTASKRKHNDTPQNQNSQDVYEGDDYITDFTAFETENKTEMGTKMARLREIQEDYENVMADWVNEFGRVFLEEQL